MSTNNKWLTTASGTKILSDTYFNAKFALSPLGVSELANYIISPGIISSIFQNPSDWLSSLILYPFDVTNDNLYPNNTYLQIASFETDIPCAELNVALSLFNIGEIFIPRKFNNFADYNGYTKIDIWLPFYGFTSVNPNDVIGKYLEIALSVDYNTGQAVYYVCVSDEAINPDDTPLYVGDTFENCRILSTLSFQLGYQIPLGSTNTSEVYRNIIMGAVKATAVAVGAYVGGAMGAGVTTSKTTTVSNSCGISSFSSAPFSRLF